MIVISSDSEEAPSNTRRILSYEPIEFSDDEPVKRIDASSFLVKAKVGKKELQMVNKTRTKAESITEMTVLLDSNLTLSTSSLLESGAIVKTSLNAIPNSVLFNRLVKREWCLQDECYKPCLPRIVQEPFALVVLTSDQIVELTSSLELVDSIKRTFNNYKIILLVQGMEKYFKSIQRQIQSAFNAAFNGQGTFQPTPVDKSKFNDLYLKLQFDYDFLIQFTESDQETADLIVGFTREISILEQKINSADGFKVKSGTNLTDTFKKMLQQVNLVTESIANAIVLEYPTLNLLYLAFEERGSNLLADLKLNSQKRIGTTISNRIYDLLMNPDPECLLY